jgi:serine/threonine-protein kinase
VDLSPDLIIADRFRLVRPLGEGGMGAVWLAHHIRLQIPCAVKFMHPEVAAEPSYRARFDREAIAAARIRSPHVVQVLDHGVWEGAPYIAMEYLEGEDLEHRLARRGTLSPAETATIMVQVARALNKAHAAGLVHRDLKPANVFLVHDDDREIVKVLDFGVAKIDAQGTGGQTRTGAIMGTPYYMSPEQAQGTKAVDHRSDLWALGVVAYQCLTGAVPFSSDAFGDLVLKIVVEPIPVPSAIAPVPPGFDAWWVRAVARDPAQRFQSAKELAEALVEALGVSSVAGIGAPATGEPAAVGAGAPDKLGFTPVTPVKPAGPATTGPLAAAVSAAAAPPPARSRSFLVAALALAGVIAAGGLLTIRGRGTPAPAVTAQSSAPSAPSPAPAPPPVVEASPAPSASAVAPAASSAAAAPAPPAPPASASAAVSPVASAPARPLAAPKPAKPARPQIPDIGF